MRTVKERRLVEQDVKGLALCFYGDGPLWQNALQALSFPPGYSYSKPFRYKDNWVQSGLQDLMRSHPLGFERIDAILGTRFKQRELGVIPIRRITITNVDSSPGNNYIDFRFGSFFQIPTDTSDLASTACALPDTVTEELFFTGFELPSDRGLATDDVDAWTQLVDLLGHTSLPLKEEAKNGVFFYLDTPRGWRKSKAKPVDRSRTTGFRYGLRLPEGAEREAVLMHRIPSRIGTETSVDAFDLSLTGSNETAAVTPPKVEVSSNYGRYILTIVGSKSMNLWSPIEVDIDARQSPTGGVNVAGLDIPVRTVPGLWHRFWTLILPLVALAGAFLGNALVTNYKTFENDTTKLLLAAGISAVASVIILLFKRP
jgi:hypothetical protein